MTVGIATLALTVPAPADPGEHGQADPPPGVVRLSGPVLHDDDGPFNGLGATLMWAAWGYRHARQQLERELAVLAAHDFDYIRALGVVGDPAADDFWDGREIDRRWPDYAEVIAGVTDLAYDRYGLRVQWTLIGDGDVAVPGRALREALVRTFVDVLRNRAHKVILLEIANEAWQNGFDGKSGVVELRHLTRYLRDRLAEAGLTTLVAASAPREATCEGYREIYAGDIADVATLHFDRTTSLDDGPWRPIWLPWALADCDPSAVGSNNEPIGPGSSVYSEANPYRLVAAAISTYMAGLPLHVYHSSAGVRGDLGFLDLPNGRVTLEGFLAMKAYLPPDVAGWSVHDPNSGQHPFEVPALTAGSRPAADARLIRATAAVHAGRFVVLPIGIQRQARLVARRPIEVEVRDPLTGALVERRSLDEGEALTLDRLPVYLISGRFLAPDGARNDDGPTKAGPFTR